MFKPPSWLKCPSFGNWQSQAQDDSSGKIIKGSVPEPDGVLGEWIDAGEGTDAEGDQWESLFDCHHWASEEWQLAQRQDHT